MKPCTSDPIQPRGLSSGYWHRLAWLLVGALACAGSWPAPSTAAVAKAPRTAAPMLSWQMMRGLNFQTGEMTPELQVIINGAARVAGYMVPLEDELEEVTEFLLVPYAGACIHVPPP